MPVSCASAYLLKELHKRIVRVALKVLDEERLEADRHLHLVIARPRAANRPVVAINAGLVAELPHGSGPLHVPPKDPLGQQHLRQVPRQRRADGKAWQRRVRPRLVARRQPCGGDGVGTRHGGEDVDVERGAGANVAAG